ncbi:SRPBCC family protein [Streptomyces sp. HNM0575]|uniref:SRPBCC family protein n=1 Tax=Streptomyces sp. HNM0575 TaxID=2716338 RepID=UPI00145FAB02|nr:SRPBCC family protein [Streptomyces sp. HNM0575]NLU75902.1 SRPBCC family protein [Streptomyces sp. HNM0575]
MDRGTYFEYNGRPAVRFQRTYPYPVERLWAAITEPGELAHWFPSAVRMEARAGGKIEFSDDPNLEAMTGTVLVHEPPRRLAFTWGGDELHFEIDPVDDGGCALTLINVLEAENTAARNAAGWTVCLTELGRHVSGATAQGPHSETAEPWRPVYDDYVASGMPSGAPVPGMPEDDEGR